MPRIKLTAGRIRDFDRPTDKAQAFLWDTELPGLAVRVTAGAKAYIFQSKLNGKDLRITIGDVRAWTLDDARAEARRLQTLVDKKIDPRELVREQQAAKEAAKQAEREAAEAKRAAAEAARIEAERQGRYTLRALCDAYVGILERGGKAKSAAEVRS